MRVGQEEIHSLLMVSLCTSLIFALSVFFLGGGGGADFNK